MYTPHLWISSTSTVHEVLRPNIPYTKWSGLLLWMHTNWCTYIMYIHRALLASSIIQQPTQGAVLYFNTDTHCRILCLTIEVPRPNIPYTKWRGLFFDILQPLEQPDLRWRCSWISCSIASEPEPSRARVSPALHVLLVVHCIVTVALLGREGGGDTCYASQKVDSTLTPL